MVVMTTNLEAIFGVSPEQAKAVMKTLTPRELQVAHAIASGALHRRIADAMGISCKTLDIHRCKVKRKLGTTVHGIPRIVYASKFAEEAEPAETNDEG